MCGSHNNHDNGGFCCPDPQIFVEKNCGNLRGPLGTPAMGDVAAVFAPVWTGPTDGDYFQGTFEVFNCGPVGDIQFLVDPLTTPIVVPPGNSKTVSVNNPNNFRVLIPTGTSGKFCITLYKRVFC
ncbi:S-Ena type endospore appendage [Peribacillus alkalitolerans]|uniref:S-Ena type endospore appendage n=1 Tax=Peribacillus alkalitolerans TaxID=1550385 RepID=UPI0013D60347|nr:S-Ena type endospore appendage [Peribacillus alkalitolerans]